MPVIDVHKELSEDTRGTLYPTVLQTVPLHVSSLTKHRTKMPQLTHNRLPHGTHWSNPLKKIETVSRCLLRCCNGLPC